MRGIRKTFLTLEVVLLTLVISSCGHELPHSTKAAEARTRPASLPSEQPLIDTVADKIFTGEPASRLGQKVTMGEDINGDGYCDMIIGAPYYNDKQGRVYIYYGGKNSTFDTPDFTLTGEDNNNYFGHDIEMADFNNDNHADIVIAAPGYNSLQGRVYIFYGGRDFNATTDKIFDGEPGTGGVFGRMIAAGDVNNDGCAELLVGATYLNSYKGRAYLFYGAPGTDMDTVCDLTIDGHNAGDRFGKCLALGGDVDGDGYGDVIVGGRAYPSGNNDGRAYLFYGGDSIDNTPDLIFDDGVAGSDFATDAELFDIDNDGYADILISARNYNVASHQGRVYLYWGAERTSMNAVADKTFTGELSSMFGGDDVDCGYINNDNYGDICVGASDYPNNTRFGRVYLYYGNSKALLDTDPDKTFDGENSNDRFGFEVALGDINGDGFGDILIGARTFPSEATNQGRAYLYYGGLTEPKPTQEIKSLHTAATDVNIDQVKSIVPEESEESPYLKAVLEFADNVLKYGRDTYGPKHTPLFVDGLMVRDPNDPNYGKDGVFKPVEWIAPNGERWILSNLASQQNLFRTLDGLTKITGDPKYRQAAVEAIKYAFDNLRSPNGLLYWGRATAYDAQADGPIGSVIHCLKFHYPYYGLMWDVNLCDTKKFIESFWSAHILDWSNLDMNRTARRFNDVLEEPWKHEYKGGPVFFESKVGFGRSFMDAGSDLFYGAAVLSKLSGSKDPLIWAKRLARRYVETRDPNIGIAGYVYTRGKAPVQYPFGDDFKGHLVLFGTLFPVLPGMGNPSVHQWLLGELIVNPGIVGDVLISPWVCQFLLGEMLGSEGEEFTQWALEELTAWGKTSYRKKDNSFIPMLTDGTSLELYVCKEDSMFGPRGTMFMPIPAVSMDFWAYALAYRITGDGFMWEMARNIAQGNGLGDIGAVPENEPKLQIPRDHFDPYTLLALLELYKKTEKTGFVQAAQEVGDNILASRFHKGFFVPTHKHTYVKFDNIEPLILLHLDVVLKNAKPLLVPQVWPNRPSFVSYYRYKEPVVDNRVIYNLTESSEPPLSLKEAAAIGEIDEIKSLISKGADVNGREDTSLSTALHRGAINGHKDVVELLLVKGADIDAVDASAASALHFAAEKGHNEIAELLIAKGADVNAKEVNGGTPLHSAARAGHKEIVELLIAEGADVNAKNNDGQRPVDVAVQRGQKEIAELLLSKSCNVSLHTAAYFGDLQRVEELIDDGVTVDAKDQRDQTALHYAAKTAQITVAKFLIANGADINAGKWTPLQEAAYHSKEIVELLLAKGANINTGEWTALHSALDAERFDIVELLLAKGADANIRDGKGRTPLHIAAWYAAGKNPKIVELLLSKGADINAKDHNGKTALLYAIENGHTEIAELLRKHGANE